MRFRDLTAQYTRYQTAIDAAIQEVLNSTEFISGPAVTRFEEHIAQVAGTDYCVSCANGTDALSLVMMAWGIGKGDAVFVPDYTFFATAEIVSHCGATPIFVDVDPRTFNIDPHQLQIAIEKVIAEGKLFPKVIIPVDLFGVPADYPALEAIAKQYGLKILEDGAQGFGASVNGKMVGSFGDIATTSFFPVKPLGCYGDGGAIFTNDKALVDLLKSIRVHGKGDDKYDNVRIGVNSRLDTLQAAILDVKLDALMAHELHDVHVVAARYDHQLSDAVITPLIPQGVVSAYAQYTIQLRSAAERAYIVSALKAHDIPTMIYYTIPLHRQKAFKHLTPIDADFPVSNRLSETALSLPIGPYMPLSDVDTVCGVLLEALKTFRGV
jgi:UDP-2-acetamido-2-deoxy-ribo-hexuluronate aminotransferase